MCDGEEAVVNIDSLQLICESLAFTSAASVGACAVGAGACWLAKKVARSARQIVAVSLVGAVLIGGMVVVGTDDAGTKPGTNDVTQVEGGTNTMTQTEVSTNVLGGAVQGRAQIPAVPQSKLNEIRVFQRLRRARRSRPTILSHKASETQCRDIVSQSMS